MIRRKKELEKFLSKTEFSGAELYPLAGDASARRYVRVVLGDRHTIVMDTPAEGENFHNFVAIAESLYLNGYSAPKILARDMQAGFLLLEDFGENSFTQVLIRDLNCTSLKVTPTLFSSLQGDSKGGGGVAIQKENCQKEDRITSPSAYNDSGMENTLYCAAVDLLVQWYKSPVKNLPPLPLYDEELYLREVSLFPDWFLPKILGEHRASELRSEYMNIWRGILSSANLSKEIFVHRDFHADNLMWLGERSGAKRVGLLDFQDGVFGDAAYDMVSLLEDARRDVSLELAESMIARYLSETGIDEGNFRTAYDILGAQRNSKIIGIFVRLAVRDGKDGYLKFLPLVWSYLQRDVANPLLKDLRKWLKTNVHGI